jgi:hypothetical protein
MIAPALGTNFAVFVLFFGIATLDALRTRDWLKVVLWVALALVFLREDFRARPREPQQPQRR